MTWPDELAALGTGGLLTAILYWVVRRVAARLEEILKQVLQLLSAILAKLDQPNQASAAAPRSDPPTLLNRRS